MKLAAMFVTLLLLIVFSIVLNQQSREAAVQDATHQRTVATDAILKRIDERTASKTADRFRRAEMQNWLERLRELNPGVNVPDLPRNLNNENE